MKNNQLASLLQRPEGCTYSEIAAQSSNAAKRIDFYAKANGLRLRKDMQPGQPIRYFGYKPKIEIRDRTTAPPPRTALEDFCIAHDLKITTARGGVRMASCIHCHLGYVIPNDERSVPGRLAKRIEYHFKTHRRKRVSK